MELKKSEMALQRRLGIGQLLLGMFQAKTGRIASTKTRSGGGSNYLGRDEKLEFLRKMQLEETRREAPIKFYGSSH